MNKDDFELEQTKPTSIRQMVIDELECTIKGDKAYEVVDGRVVKPESIDDLMKRVYAHIERKALEVYHSNEPWALKYWAIANLFKDEVNEAVLDSLISPITEWQTSEFDPIKHYSEQLKKKSYSTQKSYMVTASRFVSFIGRKRHYTDEDVQRYLNHMIDIYPNDSSYYQDCVRLLQFLRRLPGADRHRELPDPDEMKRLSKKAKKKTYAKALTLEDLETLAWICVIDNLPANIVIRLACSTIYGRRVGELTKFEIHLNGDSSYIKFPIEKGGEEPPHLIPETLVPLFKPIVTPMSTFKLQRVLKKVCRSAGITLPYKCGYHSIRRRVATIVRKSIGSDINAFRFMRWSEPRELNILAQYDQLRYEEIDREVLQKHPLVKVWEQVIPYLMDLNSDWRMYHNM